MPVVPCMKVLVNISRREGSQGRGAVHEYD